MAILSDDEALAMFQSEPPAAPQDRSQPLVDEKGGGILSDSDLDAMFGSTEQPTPNKPSAMGDVLRGIDNLQATGGGLAMLLGNATDLEGLESWGQEVYDRNEMEARMNPAAVGSFANINSPSDLLVYAREAVLENLPMFLPSLGTGGVGAVIGKKSAETFVKNLAEKMTAEQVAKLVAKRVMIGSTLGAYASSAAMETGSIYGDVVEQTGEKDPFAATVAGMAAGALDALPEGKLLTNILGPKIGKEVIQGFAKRLGVEGTKQFLREAPTEAIQTIIEEAAVVQADPRQDLFSSERVNSYIDAFAKGGIAGGVMGMAGEAAGSVLRPHPNSLVREKEEALGNKVNEQLSPPEAEEVPMTPNDERLGKINERLDEIDEVVKSPTATPEEKAAVHLELPALVNETLQLERGALDEEGQKKVAGLVAQVEGLKAPPAEGAAPVDVPAEVAKIVGGIRTIYDEAEKAKPTEGDATSAAAPIIKSAPEEERQKLPELEVKLDTKTSRDEGSGVDISATNKEGKVVGRLYSKIRAGKELRISNVQVEEDSRGMGVATKMYEQLIKEAESRNLVLASDNSVTKEAQRIWESLEKKGYIIERNPTAKVLTDNYYGKPTERLASENAAPVFKLIGKKDAGTLVNENKPDPVAAMRQSKRNALETEKAYLQNVGEASGMDAQSRNVRIKEIDAQLADDQKLDTLSNEPTFNFPTRQDLPEGIDKQAVQETRERAQAAVETLVNETDDQEAGARYKGAMMGMLEPYMNLFTGERVKFKRSPKGPEGGFQVYPTPKGEIEVRLPSMSEWNRKADKEGFFDRGTGMFPKIGEEEAIHVADVARMRVDWEKGGRRGSFFDRTMREAAKVGKWFMASQPGFAPEISALYKPKGMNPAEIGAEMMRMMVQRARTGKLTEDVAAQKRYAKTGIATTALRALIQAAQRVREIIARFLNPETSTPGIQMVYKQVNAVLDKYGVIRPNPLPPSEKVVPLVDETPESTPVSKQAPEVEDLPTPPAERKPPAVLNPKKEEERIEEERGILGATREYKELLQATRQAIDQGEPQADRLLMDAATMHARIQLKRGKKLANADSRRDAKQDFESNLQRKVTQIAYNSGVAIAKQSPIAPKGMQALPETGDMITGIAIADADGNILATGEIGQEHRDIKQEAMGELFNRNPDADPFADLQHGFIDSEGKFVSREKGFQIAKAAGQIDPRIMAVKEAKGANPSLESQDLLRMLDEETEELGAQEGGFRASVVLDELDTEASNALSRIFNPLALVNERQRRGDRGGRLRFDDFNSMEMEYMSQPKDPTFFAAKDFMDKLGGVQRTAEFLLRDEMATSSSLEGGEIAALYQLAIVGLEKMRTTLEETQADFVQEDQQWIEDTLDKIDQQYAVIGTRTGQFTSNMKGHERFMTGRRARKDFVSATMAKFKKKFGRKGTVLVNEIKDKLNRIAQAAMDKVVTRGEAVAFFRKLQKDMESPEWRAEVLKTLANKNPKMDAISRNVGLRAAQLGFDNLENEPALKAAVRRILSDMTFGMPKASGSADAHSILSAAISEVVRSEASFSGAIPKVKAKTKVAELQKLAEILNNPELYEEFVQNIEERMVNKFAGKVQADAITNFIDRLRGRAWMEGMMETLVNEKMKEMKTSIDKIARKTYGEGKATMDNVRHEVQQELESYGVTDPDVIDQIVEDLDAHMQRAADSARAAFAASGTAVRQSLREIGTTIARVAKAGLNERNEIAQTMSAQFIKSLGMADTTKFPHATTLAGIIRWQMDNLVQGQRENAINTILTRAQHPELAKALTDRKGKKKSAVEKIIEYANMGALNDPQVYNALAENLGMPLLNDADIQTVQDWGTRIGNMDIGAERTREILKLRNFIESKAGVTFSDMLVAGMYASMLSGPSTHAVNLVSNALNLMGSMWVEGIRNPRNIPAMVRATMIGLTRGGATEFRETIATGLSAGKLNQKIEGSNPLEFDDPIYLDKKTEGLGKLLSLTRMKYVVRFLQATDMMFYKAAQELSFASKTGYVGNALDWETKVTEAERSLAAEGVDTNTSEGRRAVKLRALQNYEAERARDPRYAQAWEESHGDALAITFNQEPKGWIGKIANMIANFTAEYPIGKLLIPFTKVVANVLNTQIEWSPFGIGRWALSEDFKIKDIDGNMVRDPRILIRALSGTGLLAGLSMLLALYDGDDDDPWFTIYGSGPKDANKKRQLYERGWKPNTIKVGGSYISYLATPLSLSLASLGTLLDRRRDDPDIPVLDYAPQLAMAFVQGTLNQSFLTGVADLFAAFESPDPERKVQRFAARTLTLWVPNLLKQIDAWADPSVQQSQDFLDMVLNQIPVVRQMGDAKPMLNVFGKPVYRVQGPLGIPFSNRFITMQETRDPVTNFLSTNGLTVPSYSRQTKMGDRPMTEDEFYEYVEKSGPQVYESIRRTIPEMRRMTKEEKQEMVNDLSTRMKKRTRDLMRSRRREPLTLLQNVQ